MKFTRLILTKLAQDLMILKVLCKKTSTRTMSCWSLLCTSVLVLFLCQFAPEVRSLSSRSTHRGQGRHRLIWQELWRWPTKHTHVWSCLHPLPCRNIRNAETRLGCLCGVRKHVNTGAMVCILVGIDTPPWCGTRSPINLSGHERCVEHVRWESESW